MRKKIGVLMCEGHGEYQTMLLHGITKKAKELDYDVLVFTNFVKACHNINIELSENNIFNLVNFDLLDGVIVATDSFAQSRMQTGIHELLDEKCHCPVVMMDYPNDKYDYTIVDDAVAFEELANHLIEVHGCRKILFCSGPYEVSSTRTRLKGYLAALEKHGIEKDDDLITFDGKFWTDGGYEVARGIIEGKRQRPDAILFCGDYMAIGAMKAFQEAGWNIPEDIKLIGFDSVEDALRCQPPITSCEAPVDVAGENAMELIDARINGKMLPKPRIGKGKINIGGSCGCPEDLNYTRRAYLNSAEQKARIEFASSNILEDLAEAEDITTLFKKIQFYMYQNVGWNDFFLCLIGDWMIPYKDGVKEKLYSDDGFPGEMHLFIEAKNKFARIVNKVFDTSQMLPYLEEEHDAPKTYYFIPLHLNNKNFGYSVISYENSCKTFDSNYCNWTKHIALALEYRRIQTKLTATASIDVLSGIYTRLGLEQNLRPIEEAVNETDYPALAVVIDLDGLKKINDNIGHKEGDAAIKKTGEILKELCGWQEICARTGGDEFVMYGCKDYEEGYDKKIIKIIEEKVDKINEAKTFPFKLSLSIGAVMRKIDNIKEIDDMYGQADEMMYKMKEKHHAVRKV